MGRRSSKDVRTRCGRRTSLACVRSGVAILSHSTDRYPNHPESLRLSVSTSKHSSQSIRQRQHRLPKEYYLGRTVSFTVCVKSRMHVLNSAIAFHGMRQLLFEAVEYHQCNLILFLFMPDHLHCILQGVEHDSDVLSAMKRFKQRSGYWMRRAGTHFKWQKGFFDHILRTETDLQKHIRYILQNPVRAELVQCWSDYAWKGSNVLDLDLLEDL